MNYQELTEAHRAQWRGDSISDEQLNALLQYYRALDKTLSSCRMPQYDLMQSDVRRNLDQLEGFLTERKRKISYTVQPIGV